MSLTDKVCIVTGAGQGIGRGIALRLARDGAYVVSADINGAAARQVAKECGPKARGYEIDVRSSSQCDELVETIAQSQGRLDVVVNWAGINRDSMLHKMTDEQWQTVIDVDLSQHGRTGSSCPVVGCTGAVEALIHVELHAGGRSR